MLLVKKGAGAFTEMSTELKEELVKLITGKPLKDFVGQKRPFVFHLKGTKGYTKTGKWGAIYNTGRGIPQQYTFRHKGTTYTVALCEHMNEEKEGGMISQKMYDANGGVANMFTMNLIFKLKSMSLGADESDRALFMMLYPECLNSPFRKQGLHYTYEWFKPQEKAKNEFARRMEVNEIERKIMFELDLFTLKSYCMSLGVSNVDLMEEEEIRMRVVQDAVSDIEKFKKRLSASTFSLAGDVFKFYESGVLRKQTLDNQDIWSYNKGELAGNIITTTRRQEEDKKLTEITKYLFDNPRTVESLKEAYLAETGLSKEDLGSGSKTLAQTENFAVVEDLIAKGIIYIHKPTKNVYGKFADGTKELLVENSNMSTFKEEVSDYLETRPDLLVSLQQ